MQHKAISITAWLFSIAAMAQEAPIKFKEWTVERKAVTNVGSDVCVASTTKKEKEQTWKLFVLVDASKDVAPAIYLTTDANVNVEQFTTLTDGSSVNKFLFTKDNRFDAALGAPAFWFAPQKFAQLNRQLRRDNSLKVAYKDAAGKEQRVYLSLSGSTAALTDISKKCALAKELFYPEFFDYVDALKFTPDPNFKDRGLELAWNHLDNTWAQYLEGSRLSASLKAVQTQMDPLLAAQKRYLEKSGKLTRDIESKTQAKTKLEEQNRALADERTRQSYLLDQKNNELQAANAVLQSKEEAYRPLREQIRPFESAVEDAESQVNRWANAQSAYASQIREAEQAIDSLNSSIAQTNRELDDAEDELSRLNQARIRAQADLNGFNFTHEVNTRLANDSSYQSALRNQRDAERNAGQEERELRFHEQEVRRTQQALNQCRNRRDPENKPVNCSQEEQAHRQAENERDNSQRTLRAWQERAVAYEREAEERQRGIENEVRRIHQILADRVTNLDQQIVAKQSEIRDYERQISRAQAQLPIEERRLADGRSGLNQANSERSRADRELVTAERELASFKTRTDYVRIEREYQTAANQVQTLRAAMAAIDREIQKLSTSISRNSAAIAALQSELETLLADAAKNVKELEGVEAQLNPLKAEKERLSGLLAESQRVMQESGLLYRAVLKNTLEPPAPVEAKFHSWM
jgi:predicted  nucleic acid-binding Zn-ribbon protein